MLLDARLLAFLGVAALLTITPGADMAVVTRNTLSYGRSAALRTILGINSGLMFWGAASAAGVSALLTASATAFTVLKLVGAAYLIYLGLHSIWQTRTGATRSDQEREMASSRHAVSGVAAYRQGLLSNLFNPKVGVFYTTFLPQFITPGESVFLTSLLLACIHNLMGFLWLIAYTHIVTKAGSVLRRSAVRRALDRLTGSVLIGFGVRLAMIDR